MIYEWKTLDTLPRDGRQIAVWVVNGDITPHCFSPVSVTSDGGWWDDSTGDQIEPIKGATHWISISPPEPKGE